MRNLLFCVLGSALFVTACATSSSRPNSAHAMEDAQRPHTKDPHDHVKDPTIGNNPPQDSEQKPLCRLQCGPKMHCDASGFIERCVPDEEQKP